MNGQLLTDDELLRLIERYRPAPGIVRGIVMEHQARGGSTPPEADHLLGEFFGGIGR